MFISDDKTNSYEKGDIVITLKDIEIPYGIFLKGHEFTYLKKDGYGIIMIDNEHNIKVCSVRGYDISLKMSPVEAKKLHIKRQEKIKLKEFCRRACPNKEELKDYYDSCKLGTGYINKCNPKMNCLQYIDNDTIKKNKFMSNYLRRLKIEKCLKKVTQ